MGERIPAPPRLRTGVLAFDVASGGGVPRGNLTIVWGGKDTGKSMFLYTLLRNYLRNHEGRAALIDTEENYDTDFGDQLGIDNTRLLVARPDYGEQAVDMVEFLIRDVPEVGLIAIDSLADLVPAKEVDKGADEGHVGGGGLLIARFCKKLRVRLGQAAREDRDVTVVATNQLRHKVGLVRGSPHKMPGGEAAYHRAHMIVRTFSGRERAEGDSSRPNLKHVEGTIEKRKGPVVTTKFQYDMAVAPYKDMGPGDVDDWGDAWTWLERAGQAGKRGKGYFILSQEFERKRDCRAWYLENRDAAAATIIEHLMENPQDVE